MTRRTLEGTLWTVALGFLVGGIALASTGGATATKVPRTDIGSAPQIRSWSRSELGAAGNAVVASNPFRVTRQPSNVEFGAASPMPAAFLPPKPPNPPLKVSGIIGGPPWAAVVEGLPGREGGVLVRSGDVINAFKIRSVGRDTVVIVGADTTWKLTVRRAW